MKARKVFRFDDNFGEQKDSLTFRRRFRDDRNLTRGIIREKKEVEKFFFPVSHNFAFFKRLESEALNAARLGRIFFPSLRFHNQTREMD